MFRVLMTSQTFMGGAGMRSLSSSSVGSANVGSSSSSGMMTKRRSSPSWEYSLRRYPPCRLFSLDSSSSFGERSVLTRRSSLFPTQTRFYATKGGQPPSTPPPTPSPAVAEAEQTFQGMTVVDGTALNFQALMHYSQSVPIIVDFYADWCAPCKKLTPMLVSRAQKGKGKVLLVKVNTDKEEQIASIFRIESLPTVVAIYQQRPLGSLVGLASDQEIDDFFAKVLAAVGINAAEETLLTDGNAALEAGDIVGASQHFSQILTDPQSTDSGKVAAMAGLIHSALAEKNLAAAQNLVAVLKKNYTALIEGHQAAQQAISATELAESFASSSQGGSVDEWKEKIKANPEDPSLHHQLAILYLSQSKFEDGLTALLSALKVDRTHSESKQLLFKTLETLGPDHPLTPATRRRLANILFV